MRMQRIAVVGTGAVGGYFGGRLAEAGYQTCFVARGETLTALQQVGLRVHSPLGNIALLPSQIRAVATLAEVGPVDAVILAVKTWQVPELAPQLVPAVAEGGVVLPLQNGVEAPDQLAAVLGRHRVLGGLCRIMAQRIAPAEIRHIGAEPTVILGTLPSSEEAPPDQTAQATQAAQTMQAMQTMQMAQALQQAFVKAGVRCSLHDQIVTALWEKLAFIAAVGGVGAATRSPVGEVRSLAESRALLAQAVTEVSTVAAAQGVPLASDLPASALSYIDNLPAAGTASLQRDIAAGVPSELEALIGVIVRQGRAFGVATPLFSTLYACLLPSERRARDSR